MTTTPTGRSTTLASSCCSLPANNEATGKPEITGTALVGQILTATKGDVADADGLPTVFNYQWKRVDSDGTSNPTNIGTDSTTYTLTDTEVGKRVLVEVSFTEDLSGVESRTSAAYPGTGTVSAALALTRQEDKRYNFTESDFSNLPSGRVTLPEVIITELPNNGWLAGSKKVLLPSGNYQLRSDRIYSTSSAADPHLGKYSEAASIRFSQRPTGTVRPTQASSSRSTAAPTYTPC